MADFRMDYEAVEAMAKGFDTAHDVLNTVDQILDAAITALQTASFIGVPGAAAAAAYFRSIKPKVEQLAATCDELSGDLVSAVATIRDSDFSGSQRFASRDAS